MKVRATILVLGFLAIVSLPEALWAADYKIDSNHSTVNFKIRHLFSQVMGRFNQFEGSFSFDPNNYKEWKASATIQAASIDTNVEKRDNHLRSADFFDVATYPTITFHSTRVLEATAKGGKVEGMLSMHGIEKVIVLDVKFLGEGPDPWGNVRSGFTATTTLNRKDFGLTWNKTLETGQLMVGEDVEITLEIEGIRQA